MTRLSWDEVGERFYETGTKCVVVYPKTTAGAYDTGAAWNGVTAITDRPSGAEETALYANNHKYLGLRSAEECGLTIEAYTYPDEWAECDGSVNVIPGAVLHQQTRKGFGLTYRTELGNDVAYDSYGYKLHLVWNGMAAPSEKSYQTINDSPEAITFSWEVSTTPVEFGNGLKPSAYLEIDSTKINAAKLTVIENLLYGTENTEPTFPTPAQILEILDNDVYTAVTPQTGANPQANSWYELDDGTYTATTDTSVTEGKTYYAKN